MKHPTLIIYGSSLGNTRFIAEKIQEHLPQAKLMSVADINPDIIANYPNLILGTSTWGIGALQDEFQDFVEMLVAQNLEGKTIALFGLGNQFTYPDTFCDGMGKLYKLLENKGIKFVGEWPAHDYDFASSEALIGDKFVGLAIDEDNEPDLSDFRVKKWVELILPFL